MGGRGLLFLLVQTLVWVPPPRPPSTRKEEEEACLSVGKKKMDIAVVLLPFFTLLSFLPSLCRAGFGVLLRGREPRISCERQL